MNIYAIGVLVSIVIYILIGIYAGKRVKTIEDYYVCGRNATTLFIAGTMFASMLSTNGFMGDTAYCYSGNITTILLINTLCASGYVIGALFFGRYIRRSCANTMPTYFANRFNSQRIKRLAGLITVISLSAYLLSVLQGTSILMESLTGYNRLTCLVLSWICIMFFTLYSGSQGVILTDTIMCIFFLLSTIIAGPYIFDAAGGLGNLVSNLASNPNAPNDILAYHGNRGDGTVFDIVIYGITIGIVWMITVGVSPWQAGRNLMAKNEHVIFRSSVISALLTVFFLLYLYLMAISTIEINPYLEQPEKVIIYASYEVVPKFIGVILLTGIMSAGLSSASTFLSVASFSLSSDILNIDFKSEKAKLKFTRSIVFIFGTLALILAYINISSIRVIAWFASTIIAASWGYVAFASVWDKKLTERGAFYAMIGGFVGYLVSKILRELSILSLNSLLNPFFIGVFFSVICGIFASLGQKRTKKEIDFQAFIHVIPKKELVAKDYRIDKIYSYILIFSGILLSSFLVYHWALPFNNLKN